ncbi:MAG: polysulfide reductase NrfD [Bacteroidales bacterium]|nr:polysulfide reductase NrfD [Bacteroidales bacterium]
MKEELFVSGRDIPFIDPVLHIWHWQIPLYLFVGGLAAGLIFFASYFYLSGKEKEYPIAVQVAPFLAPIVIVLGLIALLLDLRHPAFFWQLYTTIRLDSPMSWGAWTLGVVMPLSVLWPLTYIYEIRAYFDGKIKLAVNIIDWIIKLKNRYWVLEWVFDFSVKNRKAIAIINLVLSIVLGVYTGILLSAFNARPLWNTSLLGPLFLVSGLSTGAATIMWMAKDHHEKITFSRIDLLLIAIELFFIVHLFMGFLASTAVQQEAAALFLGGEFTAVFWGFFVMGGLVFPAILEILELIGYKIPISIPAFFILFGGALFRFIMVEAGQITRYLY